MCVQWTPLDGYCLVFRGRPSGYNLDLGAGRNARADSFMESAPKNDMWRNGGSGGNFSVIPPQASLPPYCVIKNGVLIFRKKALRDGFLRTFERV